MPLTAIAAIQGAGHKSPFVGGAVGSPGDSGGTLVTSEGVVTALAGNGFYLQDAVGDGDDATSEGIFVFTGAAPAASITIGEAVQVTARVDEVRPTNANNLTVTQLNATVGGAGFVELGGATAIDPVKLGANGRRPPSETVIDPGFTTFDPADEAIDFWESLEGMLVKIPSPVAVSTTTAFRTRDPLDPANAEGPPNEEFWVVSDGAFDLASQNQRGGLVAGPTDANPERIQIDDRFATLGMPEVTVGDRLSPITGVVGYDAGNYEVLVAVAPTVAVPTFIAPETTTLAPSLRQLTIGTYNVENLDPVVESTAAGAVAGADLYTRLGNSDDDVGSGKYAQHAAHIALNMGAPAIVGLQEIQDSDGTTISSVVDATATLQLLVDLIFATYGIRYAFACENPPAPNQDGGLANANIRPAFLYRADVVELLELARLTDPDPAAADGFAGDDFAATRKPLVGTFAFNGETLTVVNNHFLARTADDSLFGNTQPPVARTEPQRLEQARVVHDYVAALGEDARVVVLGDLNDLDWSAPLLALKGELLTDLGEAMLPANERYTYNFQGNVLTLDHLLVSGALRDAADPAYDIVHVNSEFAGAASDHDPAVARLDFSAFGETLKLGGGNDTVDGLGGDDSINGAGGDDTLSGGVGNDLVKGGGGEDAVAGGSGNDRLVGGGGNDRLIGDEGNDRLVGEAGADRLSGGLGNDTFQYTKLSDSTVAASGRDRITDFALGDLIDLSAIDANTATGGNQAFSFIGATSFGGVAGQLQAVQQGGFTFVRGDVDGDAVADFAISLAGGLSLTATDFVL